MVARRKKQNEIAPLPSDPTERIRALIKRSDDGDKEALAELRKAIKDTEAVAKLSDLSYSTEQHWIDMMVGKAEGSKEYVKAKLDIMRRKLSGSSPTPLETLLIDRISLCWLQVQYADTIYAQNLSSCSVSIAEYMQRRQESAQRRFLSAVKTLAQVRRLSMPLIQLNVADKQINMLSSQPAGNIQSDPEDPSKDIR